MKDVGSMSVYKVELEVLCGFCFYTRPWLKKQFWDLLKSPRLEKQFTKLHMLNLGYF